MAKRALRKDLRMEIRKNRGRFLSIVLIVALGVAFFSGLRSSESDMRYTADAFADEYRMMDLRIISSMGLTDGDLEALEALPGVAQAEASKMKYVLTNRDDTDYVLELTAQPEELNRIQVTEGRMPQAPDECLADNRLKKIGFTMGDRVTVTVEDQGDETEDGDETDEDASKDGLTRTEFTIVGFGDSPMYLGMERGSATIGSGQVNGFVIVCPEVIDQDYYSQIFLTADGASDEISFTDGYLQAVEPVREAVEEIRQERCQARYDELYQEAREPLDEAKQEYEDKKADALQELSDAEKELDQGREDLEAGRQECLDQRTNLEQTRADLEKQQTELEQTKTELAGQRQQLEESREQLAQLAAAGMQDVQKETELAAADAELTAAETQVEDGLAKLAEGLAAVEEGFSDLESAEAQIAENEKTLQEKEQEYAEAKADTEEQLAEAEAELNDGFAKLEELKVPEWSVYDRDDLPGYTDYGSNAERIGAIGKVFPAIFFLVAALVALTAVTRMVEEQRTQIGTYKALGYSKADIMGKYLAYALAATLSGGILGVLVGEKLFPFVIIVCYRIMYTPLLNIVIPYNVGYGVFSVAIAVLSTSVSTLAACFRALAATPAVLMRPVAPKAGKRVWLEHIGILWRHLSFSQKAALRNLFRYKKRLIMTVFGIGCCCGLMVVGFGLKDSIMNIASIQYDNIQLYDAMVSVEDGLKEEEEAALEERLGSDGQIESHAKLMMKSMDASTDQAIRTVYVVVAKDADALEHMMVFRDRGSHEAYRLDDEGVIVSEQLAGALGISEGDSFRLKSGDLLAADPAVSRVAENYLMHYVYMTEAVYQKCFGELPDYNMYWLKLSEEGKAEEEELGKSLIDMDGVLTVTYVSTTRNMIENMLNSLYLIVIVLAISASLLAFVVIYNLNNINISERRRELATIKLLGFYDMEVAAYVYRENVYLTIVGALAGLGIGKLLHGFVINTVEVNQVMFGREVTVPSYIACVVLTIVFAIIVNAVMYFQVRRIDMVESLKSVE